VKRILLALLITLFSIPILPIAAGDSANYFAEPTHLGADGIFVDNELATLIQPGNRLGDLVFKRNYSSTLVIDIATVEEIADLADGYQFLDSAGNIYEVDSDANATRWLSALKTLSKAKRILALPYGNPDITFLREQAPAELAFYQEVASSKLSTFLGVTVENAPLQSSASKSNLLARTLHKSYRAELRALDSVATADEITSLRLQLGKVLNPELPKERADQLINKLQVALVEHRKKLRIAAGNYTITAENYDLPVTVINDFSTPVTVQVVPRANNSRVIVRETAPITIGAQSQVQVKIPIKVLASGETRLEVRLQTSSGKFVGESDSIRLRLAVISPLTTWFTTGMAIILLLAAVVQSVRRVKRRHE
jgi:hypothetical protein